jgi:hypothetical protein
LRLTEPHPFLAASLRVLREGQQSCTPASGWQLPHKGNYLLII